MTPNKAKEIFDKVVQEKESINLVSIGEEKNVALHNGTNENVSSFLKKYHDNKESCLKEIKDKKDKAEQLLKDISRA
ncbi:hypothetical protein [Helicobacter turcicus]|uniref:Uncharacterized protein n=1 Tax=Helicobacter turcicus TaxID=2867412 RepID=A0ABS7JPH3_9HELI|nr:hypothetical protein [Helicobacter turcicus]MBX7491262.1 hypothetical protein [Helicobacter turcicus]MBX7546099.1 hypothetical protein [Helicobacter turcicus]